MKTFVVWQVVSKKIRGVVHQVLEKQVCVGDQKKCIRFCANAEFDALIGEIK